MASNTPRRKGASRITWVSLKSAGRGIEAAELQKKVAMLDSSAGTKEKVEMAVKAGDQEFQQRKIEDAEKSYKQAVDLAQSLPPGDENLIVALGRLGNVYAVQRKYTEASVAFHQQLAIVEKTFGANSERSVESLQLLGRLAAFQKNYKEAESYLQRALAIETQGSGDNNPRAEEALRALAGSVRDGERLAECGNLFAARSEKRGVDERSNGAYSALGVVRHV